MLNCCVVLAEVDNAGIPSFPANIQSCSDGKKSLKSCIWDGKMAGYYLESVLQIE